MKRKNCFENIATIFDEKKNIYIVEAYLPMVIV